MFNFCLFIFSDLTFTPEELIGMLLNHSRELAEDYAGKEFLKLLNYDNNYYYSY